MNFELRRVRKTATVPYFKVEFWKNCYPVCRQTQAYSVLIVARQNLYCDFGARDVLRLSGTADYRISHHVRYAGEKRKHGASTARTLKQN